MKNLLFYYFKRRLPIVLILLGLFMIGTIILLAQGEFISFQPNQPNAPTPTQQTNMQNTKKTNVNPMMYPPPYNNGQFMMYPMMMPFPPHNMPGYQNPFYFYPMPMNPNMTQSKESYSDNNNTKNK